jgi:hypothetical protein
MKLNNHVITVFKNATFINDTSVSRKILQEKLSSGEAEFKADFSNPNFIRNIIF